MTSLRRRRNSTRRRVFNISRTISEVLRKHAPRIAANVTRDNALLSRLMGRLA
jgi:hypothetical protein